MVVVPGRRVILHHRANAYADELLAEAGVSRRTLFRTLDRIRRRLYDCIIRRPAVVA
jgi:hypothetical protein